MQKPIIGFILCILSSSAANVSNDNDEYLPTIWTGGSFQWPTTGAMKHYMKSGKYIPKSILATRGQIYEDDVIVTLPRFKKGVPVTLARTSLLTHTSHAIFSPFPSWSQQEEGNCQALQSAVDSYLDGQDLLWVLDVGIVNSLEQPIRRCPPKVVAYNVKNGKLIKTIDLSELVVSTSRLQYLVVDYNQDGGCFVYASDAATRAILVYDVINNKGWRVVLPSGIIKNYKKRDVLYLALVKKSNGAILYFTYLSSSHLYSIKTQFLQTGKTRGRVIDVGTKPGKIVILGTNNGTSIFFRYDGENDIYEWDTYSDSFKAERFSLVHRSDALRLGTQVMRDPKRGLMRMLESNFNDFVDGKVGCGADQQVVVI